MGLISASESIAITMKIELSGVTIEKYEHLESHRLPPHYQNILKSHYQSQ
jgi:hypothetical protein